MNLKFDLESTNAQDVRTMSLICIALNEALKGEEISEQTQEPASEEPKEEPKVIAEDETQTKPKRKRRTKAEILATEKEVSSEDTEKHSEEVNELPLEEPTPVVEEKVEEPVGPVEEKQEDVQKTCSTEEWRKVFQEKKEELQVNDGQANASKRGELMDLIHTLSTDYGNRIPSKLDPEPLARFVERFKTIVYRNNTFEIGSAPF